jgi:Nif-specific ferredoxin III
MDSCIGCGRCFKACAKGILAYVEEEVGDTEKGYMKVNNPGRCIGCGACGRTCPKKCFTFEEVEL